MALNIPVAPLNISRNMMPQIASKHLPEFIESLKKKGIHVISKMVRVNSLKPTQSEFNHDKIQNLLDKKKLDIPIIISKDNYVLDGHHRYVAELNRNKSSKISAFIVDLKINDLIQEANLFEKSFTKELHEENKTKVLKSLIREHYKKF